MSPEERSQLTDRDLLVRIDVRQDELIDTSKDHEARIRTVEAGVIKAQATADKAVTPKQLWAGFVSAAGVAGAISGFVGWVFNR